MSRRSKTRGQLFVRWWFFGSVVVLALAFMPAVHRADRIDREAHLRWGRSVVGTVKEVYWAQDGGYAVIGTVSYRSRAGAPEELDGVLLKPDVTTGNKLKIWFSSDGEAFVQGSRDLGSASAEPWRTNPWPVWGWWFGSYWVLWGVAYLVALGVVFVTEGMTRSLRKALWARLARQRPPVHYEPYDTGQHD